MIFSEGRAGYRWGHPGVSAFRIWVCVRYRGRAKRYGYKGDCTFLQSDSGYDIWNGSSCLMLLSYYKKYNEQMEAELADRRSKAGY